MMRFRFILFLILFPLASCFGQELKGCYQGFLKQLSGEYKIVYLNFTSSENYSRVELATDDAFVVKRMTFKQDKNTFSIKETTSKSSSNKRNDPRCKLIFNVEFSEKTGYWKGNYKSSDCRSERGDIVFFPSTLAFSTSDVSMSTKTWFKSFVSDYAKGYASPLVRKKEMDEFEFKSIYFDHDKSEIKEEFSEYLIKMVRVVNGHHDIRIKVTGHTDAVGTDNYNIGLSQRRAESIRAYFVSLGLPTDKLEIDFKGEKNPVSNNTTKEGKQKNRRVDFEFI